MRGSLSGQALTTPGAQQVNKRLQFSSPAPLTPGQLQQQVLAVKGGKDQTQMMHQSNSLGRKESSQRPSTLPIHLRQPAATSIGLTQGTPIPHHLSRVPVKSELQNNHNSNSSTPPISPARVGKQIAHFNSSSSLPSPKGQGGIGKSSVKPSSKPMEVEQKKEKEIEEEMDVESKLKKLEEEMKELPQDLPSKVELLRAIRDYDETIRQKEGLLVELKKKARIQELRRQRQRQTELHQETKLKRAAALAAKAATNASNNPNNPEETKAISSTSSVTTPTNTSVTKSGVSVASNNGGQAMDTTEDTNESEVTGSVDIEEEGEDPEDVKTYSSLIEQVYAENQARTLKAQAYFSPLGDVPTYRQWFAFQLPTPSSKTTSKTPIPPSNLSVSVAVSDKTDKTDKTETENVKNKLETEEAKPSSKPTNSLSLTIEVPENSDPAIKHESDEVFVDDKKPEKNVNGSEDVVDSDQVLYSEPMKCELYQSNIRRFAMRRSIDVGYMRHKKRQHQKGMRLLALSYARLGQRWIGRRQKLYEDKLNKRHEVRTDLLNKYRNKSMPSGVRYTLRQLEDTDSDDSGPELDQAFVWKHIQGRAEVNISFIYSINRFFHNFLYFLTLYMMIRENL